MYKYKSAISLGFFCSVAIELNDIGLRKASYPFDWTITEHIESVIELIDNHFEDFLKKELFYQIKEHPAYYRNIKFNIDFYHDFDELKSLDRQYDSFKEKFDRRIKRFYETIAFPTLFVRYIASNEDMKYTEENYDQILSVLKKYNGENEIVFVANSELKCTNENMTVWYVDKDENDTVARSFLKKSADMKAFLLQNVEHNEKSEAVHILKKKSTAEKTLRRILAALKIHYRHKQVVNNDAQ